APESAYILFLARCVALPYGPTGTSCQLPQVPTGNRRPQRVGTAAAHDRAPRSFLLKSETPRLFDLGPLSRYASPLMDGSTAQQGIVPVPDDPTRGRPGDHATWGSTSFWRNAARAPRWFPALPEPTLRHPGGTGPRWHGHRLVALR